MSTTLNFVGRILLASLFIVAAIGKILGFSGTVGYIASKGLPQPQVLAGATIALELVGGLLIILGRYPLPVGLALAAFCVVTGFIFHNFWALDPAVKQVQMNHFLKNIALAGALLMMASGHRRD